jgi:UDP-glucuronate 4-epimerase
MTVLVTGCAGFVGWRVATLLLEQHESVIGIDNINSSYDPRLKEWRLSTLIPHPGFKFHNLDITQWSSLDRFLSSENNANTSFERVVHLAARAGVPQSQVDPWAYIETNVTGTLNILELCRQVHVSKFAMASTSSVYGNGSLPLLEDARTDTPLSPYAASKKAAEALCYTYHHLYGINTAVLRLFTVYGPGGRPDMSIFRFVKWLTENEPLVLLGDGQQQRDFTFVDDTARGIIAALDITGYEVINLGNGIPVKLLTVIDILEKLIGGKAKIDGRPRSKVDIDSTEASNHKAQELLSWSPLVPLEDGLKLTVDWYLENRSWASKLELM